ncbi:SPOR domain-containing protein [Ramlibacter algicola]|uniref:SPOR domain-containing protein n=1 Tax=Ramlibacter algicola TaxID=2795217 RepID=A0A934UQW5_9BURK|nr:SPOR domain-containing protein [Ramlibacter algicola]MBK0392231.1 SPOR domain-containing protein [Ramlibacter algicola]
MAFFKFRKGADEAPAATGQPESVEALRRRARHRLIGAAILVLLGIVGFPLLFDTQPRPVAVDIPIEIPDRAKVKPLPPPPAPRAQGAIVEQEDAPAPAASRATAAASRAAPTASVAAAPAPAKQAASGPVREAPKAEQVAKAAPAPVEKPADKPATPQPKPADSARAQALLEGKPVQAAPQETAAEGRYVVQVGAFADASKARETRLKVEKAGLKTYTHVAETRDGKRIRVRVGPFATRAEADKAAGRIKDLELPAAILTL